MAEVTLPVVALAAVEVLEAEALVVASAVEALAAAVPEEAGNASE